MTSPALSVFGAARKRAGAPGTEPRAGAASALFWNAEPDGQKNGARLRAADGIGESKHGASRRRGTQSGAVGRHPDA